MKRRESRSFDMVSLYVRVAHMVSFLLLFVGCASTEKNNKKRHSTTSASRAQFIENQPLVTDSQTIDSVYMQTKSDYHFALGEALSLEGQTEKAIEEFKLTTIYDPTASIVRLRLATEYLKLGLMSDALEQAEVGLQIDPKNIEIRFFMGSLYSALKMYNEALVQYEKILELEPSNKEVVLYMGAIAAEQNQYEKAYQHFSAIANSKSYDKAYLGHYYIGRMRMIQGRSQFKNAEAAFKKSLELQPNFEDAALGFAEVAEMQGQREKGLQLLESYQLHHGPKKSIAFLLSQSYLESENFDKAYSHLETLEGFEPTNLNVKMKIALILIEQKKYDLAITKLEEILSISPTADKVRFYLGAVYQEVGRAKEAIQHFSRIEPTCTHYPESTVQLANIYRQQNQSSKALEVIEKALVVRDDSPELFVFYASLLEEKKEYQRGVATLEKAYKKFEKNKHIQYFLGTFYDQLGQRSKSIEVIRALLQQDPNHVYGLNFLAYTLAEMSQDLEAAERMALKANDLKPKDPFIMDTVGWVYFKQGRVEDAIRYLEAAYRLKPDEAIVAEHLGDAYYVYELVDKAREMYVKALQLETDDIKKSKIQNKVASIDKKQKPFQIRDAREPVSIQNRDISSAN